jgi:hypothetical protein
LLWSIAAMPKTKSKRQANKGRVKRQPRDPTPDRKRTAQEIDELYETSDGTVDSEMAEFDTDRYELPRK